MSEKTCTGCGSANEADARFCEGCGAALDRCCAACGTQASPTARFCRSCGGSLDGPAQPPSEGPTRKTVTVLFADLAGSTTFEEKVDAETARDVMGEYHTLLREIAEHHRAGVKKYIGDGFMAVWGVPEISAADADHAVEAAVELQDRFVGLATRVAETHGERMALRVAVNTGEVVVGSGDADLVGDALNVAARLESQCPLGHVVVGEETWRATRGRYRYEPLSPVQVKGRAAAVAVYQWAGQRSEAADSVPFVGRTHEFRRLQTALDEVVARRAARLVTVIGDPGVGKTRLAAEFAGSQQDAMVLQIRCAAEGTVALAPLVEVLRSRDLEADLPAAVPERDRILRGLNAMTGGVAGSVEETFWALRRYFEVLAGCGRLILVLDDVQWADALFLDFVEHLSEWAREAPILMVALARPELRETRPELVTVGGWVGDAIRLGGLEPAATAELAARVLGSDQLPADLLARLPSSTGGNPLFVRELVAMLVHDGVLVAQVNGWRLTIDADAIAVPPTIQALLASRLERMNTADRRVLEIASVIGTDFSPAAVGALIGATGADVRGSLDRLRRLELAQPSGAYTGDEPVWRFHHILIRDVAYRRLLKSDRAELHERLADWTEAGRRNGVFESDELVARHLESAHGYRCELGARDSHTAELALRSARCYLSAARRALDRDALVSAGAQAARGAALAFADTALRAELLLVACEAFLSAGDVSAGAPLVDELERVADDTLAPWVTCYRCQFLVYTDPSRLPEVDERLQEAIDEFARRGDHAGSAKAYRVRANARARLGRIGDCEADLFEALIAARQGSDHRQITAALGAAPNAALWGPSPAPKAGGRCLDVVRMQRMTTAAPSLEATSLRCLAVLELLRGRPDKARSMLADARAIVSDLGLRHGLMETELYAGLIESMAGDPVAAEPHFRTALEGLDSLGVGADAGQAAALLARSLLAQGRIDEADRYAAESERIAGHNLKTAIGWRAVRAEILSAQGRHRDAVAMAGEAVEVAADTDLVLDYADAYMTLGRVLADSGDGRGAAQARSRGESLYAAKDAVFLVGAPSVSVATAEQSPPSAAISRLTTENLASRTVHAAWQGIPLGYSESFHYDDRRRFGGEPIVGGAEFLAAAQRKMEQYPHIDAVVLAARGERLALISLHWWDDLGNETTSLDLFEVDDNGAVDHHGRFDEDDFASAYRELEERYYAGEGAAFAVNGLKQLEFQESVWMQDVEVARPAVQADFTWFAEPSTLKPGRRSLEELFDWRAERLRQVASFQDWLAALRWLSPDCCIGLCEMRGTGHGGEEFRWNRLYVNRYRDGLGASGREFDIADEDAAFAYAESLIARTPSRLSIRNRISASVEAGWRAVQAHDVDSVTALFSDRVVYDDRRRISGERLDKAGMQAAVMQLLANYPRVEWRPLAVRGETLELVCGQWSDDAGNEASYFDLYEYGDGDLIDYHGRFDEKDFLDAYAELERRYYAGEGAEFAEGGLAAAGWVEGIGRRDIEMVRRFSTPDFRWIASASSLKPTERSVEDVFEWLRQRGQQVASQRHWQPVIHWLSSSCAVALVEVTAAGEDGEQFLWNYIIVSELRGGLIESVREFDTEDEAFAYAESVVGSRRRLAMTNRASKAVQRLGTAMTTGDIDAALDCYSQDFVFDDRRGLRGGYRHRHPDRAMARASLERIRKQYSRFELQTLAVRGERLHLARHRWSDGSGNETIGLTLQEVDDDGRIIFDGRLDEEGFESAYAELERRYYAGEGAAYAEAGALVTELVLAESRGDLDSAFSMFATPGLRVESRSHSIFPTRTPEQLRRSLEELRSMVGSYRVWCPVVCWLSPEWVVSRHEREAIGSGGENFSWSRLYVSHIRRGVFVSVCEFDADDEEQAFAYAEKRMRESSGRLALTNRASEIGHQVIIFVRAGDFDAAASLYAEHIEYDDRRRISGEPVTGLENRRAAFERIAQQFSRFELQTLAVRGERLHLARHRWSDGSGNEATGLALQEVDADGRIVYDGRFDEEDFEGAYAELERRYYAGEGAAYAEAGATLTDLVIAGNRGDLDTVFGELFAPGLLVESRSRTIIPSRTSSELRSSYDEFNAMVSSSRVWNAAVRWLSPTVAVARQEREAVGLDGQRYEWSRIYVGRGEGRRVTSLCEFDVEFEDEAFAYAEELARETASRLAVSNRASVVGERLAAAIRNGDLEQALAQGLGQCVYEDRRRLAGDPFSGERERRAALERIMLQFNRLDMTPLAVRGEHLVLERCRRSDDAGNESTVLVLGEVDDDDQLVLYITFDEEDFNGAYTELEHRYYAGEGADSAAAVAGLTGFVTALNDGDMDKAFRPLNNPDLLVSMTSSVRWWYSALCWLSSDVCVCRQERKATGPDGERYAWTDIYAAQFQGDVLLWACRFDIDDEEQAFAEAHERMVRSRSRLAVSNRASEVRLGVSAAVLRGDLDAVASAYTEDFVSDDRRRLSGEPIVGRAGIRAAFSRLLDHYCHFDGEILAVRGDRLGLGVYRCSDDDGNETAGLLLIEVDDDDLICYEGRFDEDDFESAYFELERRHCAGEGAPFADYRMTMAKYFAARNRGDLDTLFNSLSSPDLRIESRSHSVFVVRSAEEHRASIEELTRLVGSVRDWTSAIHNVSPTWGVCRYQREALGRDGENYRWERIAVAEVREGRLHYACDFDLDDEEAAFAYAEERARAAAKRIAVTNRANEVIAAMDHALSRGDVDSVVSAYREDYHRDDRRPLAGETLHGRAEMRSAVERMLLQFNRFEWRALAVRGQRLVLGRTQWSDDAGNVSTYLVVGEVDAGGRLVYEGRFDEDDFDAAYHELDRRFAAGEGEGFAENIAVQTAFIDATNRIDIEAARKVCLPSFRVISPPTTLATEERSFAEFFAWIAERAQQVPSIRHWMSVNHWLSADCIVSRIEIRTLGPEVDEYTWPRLAVAEFRGGLIASIRQFEIDDEAAVFAYAEEVLARHASRLPLTNIASEIAEAGDRAMKAGDVETLVDLYAEDYVFDDRRRWSGDLLHGRAALRAAVERLLEQFSRFESRGIAVRGKRMALGWSRWSDAAGNQTEYLHVFETDDDGRIIYDGRFDEDDFEGALAELERRYYAGEGAAFAEVGLAVANYVTVMNRGDFDTMINELTRPEFRLENRSRSAFPDRGPADLRVSFDQLYAMVDSVWSWFPSITWVSPRTAVSRMERTAVGRDGEPYSWSRILVSTWKDGRLAALCDFDADDEDAAFACAETTVE